MTNEPVISLMGSVAEGVEGLGNEPFSQAAFALGNWREPDMSAVRFLQALSGDRLDSPVPVIVVVDAPDKERRRELFRAGVQDYLVHSDAVKLTTAVFWAESFAVFDSPPPDTVKVLVTLPVNSGATFRVRTIGRLL